MMNKTFFVLSLVFLWSIFWLLANVSYVQAYEQEDLNNVVVRFCDKLWDIIFKKTIYIETWTDAKVRFCIYNNWTKKVPITYGFTTATYNSVGNRVCRSRTDITNNDFILIPETENRTVYIDALGSKIIEEDIVVPPGMTWLQMGCLTAEVWGNANGIEELSWMFSLSIRKAFDLDVVIGGMADIENSIKVLNTTWWVYSTNKKVKTQVDEENNLTLWFLIENNWNVAQNIVITGKIYNALWFEKEFVLNNKTILPKATNSLVVNVGILPSYKWFFSVKFAIQNTPQLDFNLTDQKLTQPWYITEKAKIFVFSWISVIVAIILLLLLYKLVAPRRVKKITA